MFNFLGGYKLKKIAMITGVTGQDGSYLSEFLLNKGYEVHGIKRRASMFNTQRIEHIYEDPHFENKTFHLHYGDLTDTSNVNNLISEIRPDEVYNLGAQSHVGVSFKAPEYTSDVDAFGTLRLLESIRLLGLQDKTRFYQASTSELFGNAQETPQNENTPFYPRSPYAVAKLYSYWITVNYREAYNIFGCNGILFNHESKRRGETFVTRKITRCLSRIAMGLEDCLYIGNLDSKRDWGHAKDYVEMQWLMLQQDKPKDYVIATGIQYSVREFIEFCIDKLNLKITWEGNGINEVARLAKENSKLNNRINVGDVIVKVDEKYFRPTEVDTLLGDASKAKRELNWIPKISINQLVDEMIDHDLQEAETQKKLLQIN